MGGIRKSDAGSTTNIQFASVKLSRPLWNIAKSLPPNPKVERKVKKPHRIPVPHLTDEQAKDVIRRHLTGVPYRILADQTGFSEGNIRAICQGVNRSHLLREVEMEPKQMMGGK